MNQNLHLQIAPLKHENLPDFFDYLSIHLSENGQNETPLFHPISPEQSKLNEALKTKFEQGLNKDRSQLGWRKLWVATTQGHQIVGHIDIRAHQAPNTEHRVLLGMGVDSQFRKMKIGQQLIEFIIDYCKKQPAISWIDLEVLADNHPAIHLYKKNNFQVLCTTPDKFRIKHISYGYTSMTLNVETA